MTRKMHRFEAFFQKFSIAKKRLSVCNTNFDSVLADEYLSLHYETEKPVSESSVPRPSVVPLKKLNHNKIWDKQQGYRIFRARKYAVLNFMEIMKTAVCASYDGLK